MYRRSWYSSQEVCPPNALDAAAAAGATYWRGSAQAVMARQRSLLGFSLGPTPRSCTKVVDLEYARPPRCIVSWRRSVERGGRAWRCWNPALQWRTA
jgi:hypothetical protein